jgi:hypothetical protein
MKTLTVVGTAAMFLVGGGILVHGLSPLHHAIQGLLESVGSNGVVQAVLPLLLDAVVGVATGALVLGALTAWNTLRQKLQR